MRIVVLYHTIRIFDRKDTDIFNAKKHGYFDRKRCGFFVKKRHFTVKTREFYRKKAGILGSGAKTKYGDDETLSTHKSKYTIEESK